METQYLINGSHISLITSFMKSATDVFSEYLTESKGEGLLGLKQSNTLLRHFNPSSCRSNSGLLGDGFA
jgi:hypothetical protein